MCGISWMDLNTKKTMRLSNDWIPSPGDTFWYVGPEGGVFKMIWKDNNYQNMLLEFGNCFETELLAEIMASEIKKLLEGGDV